jgi:hypothetical protein
LQFAGLKRHCEKYTQRFFPCNASRPEPLALKAQHSRRVAAEAREMSSELHWLAHEQDRIHALGEEITRFVLNRATIVPEPSVRSGVCP